jgi:hypothetical protein
MDGTCSVVKKYNAENGIITINEAPLRQGLNLVKIRTNEKNIILKTFKL